MHHSGGHVVEVRRPPSSHFHFFGLSSCIISYHLNREKLIQDCERDLLKLSPSAKRPYVRPSASKESGEAEQGSTSSSARLSAELNSSSSAEAFVACANNCGGGGHLTCSGCSNLLCYDCHPLCERSHSLRPRIATAAISSSSSSSGGYATSSFLSPPPSSTGGRFARNRKGKVDKEEVNEEEGEAMEENEHENDEDDERPMPPAPAMEKDPREKFKNIALQSDGEKNQNQALLGKEGVCEGVIPRSVSKGHDTVFSKYPAGSTLLFAHPDTEKSHSLIHKYYHTEDFVSSDVINWPLGKQWTQLDARLRELLKGNRGSYVTLAKCVAEWPKCLDYAYNASLTIDGINKSGLCRKELLNDYLACLRPNPSSPEFVLSKNPKFRELDEEDATWLLDHCMPLLVDIMRKYLHISEEWLTDILNDTLHPDVANATASLRKSHLKSLNELDVIRQRFIIMNTEYLEMLDNKRVAQEAQAVLVAESRQAKAAEDAKREARGLKKVKCGNNSACRATKLVDAEDWTACPRCVKEFCPAELCQTIRNAHIAQCKGRKKDN